MSRARAASKRSPVRNNSRAADTPILRMTNVGYWSPQDAPLSQNTLIYVISHDSREAAKENWDGFRMDPEWVMVQTESEANGKLVAKVDSIFMDATEYSPMK